MSRGIGPPRVTVLEYTFIRLGDSISDVQAMPTDSSTKTLRV